MNDLWRIAVKVICPLCKQQFKEINLSHLKCHNLTVSEYDKLYPNHPRMSSEQRKKKNRYQHLTPEMSMKLKHSQTLAGYIDKYGEVEGNQKWDAMRERKRQSKSLKNFIRLYGDDGQQKYDEFKQMSKTKMSLAGFIQRYGDDGHQKYDEFTEINSLSNTKEYYINTFGKEEGLRKWELKNKRNSVSSMKVKPHERDDWDLYKLEVSRLTRQTLRDGIENQDKIKKFEYVVDHKYSVLEGFRNQVPPHIISSLCNLEVISHKDNSSKQERCSLTIEELFEFYTKYIAAEANAAIKKPS